MLKKISVTGTKGKSTVLRLLESALIECDLDIYGSFGIDGYYYNQRLVRDGSSCEDYLKWNKEKYPADVHLSLIHI